MNAKTFFSDRPIAYHPILAKVFGSVTAALFLSQIAYWSDKGSDPNRWIWKTEKEMTEETGLSRSEQQTARRILKGFKVLQEERRGTPARMFYLIDWEQLDVLIANLPQSSCRKPAIKKTKSRVQEDEKPQTIQRLSESTPENTTRSIEPQRDTEEFKAVIGTVEPAMGRKLRPGECELLSELWEEKPILRAHHYAYLQTRERADGFNLKYYGECLRSYRGTAKQDAFVREAAERGS